MESNWKCSSVMRQEKERCQFFPQNGLCLDFLGTFFLSKDTKFSKSQQMHYPSKCPKILASSDHNKMLFFYYQSQGTVRIRDFSRRTSTTPSSCCRILLLLFLHEACKLCRTLHLKKCSHEVRLMYQTSLSQLLLEWMLLHLRCQTCGVNLDVIFKSRWDAQLSSSSLFTQVSEVTRTGNDMLKKKNLCVFP